MAFGKNDLEEETYSESNSVVGDGESKPRAKSQEPPVKFDDLAREAKHILSTQDTFDGFKFEMNKGVFERANDQFAVSHIISMGSTQEPPSYSFCPRILYKGLIMTGKWDTNYTVFGTVAHDVSSLGLLYRLTAQSTPGGQQDGLQGEVEWKGSSWNASAAYTTAHKMIILGYTQNITNRFSAGIQYTRFGEERFGFFAGGFRFDYPNWIFSSTLNLGAGLQASYVRKATERSNFATEVTLGFGEKGFNSVVACGFDFGFHMSHIKARVDSDLKVHCVLEEAMSQTAKISLSGEFDHKKKNYRFGLSFSLNS